MEIKKLILGDLETNCYMLIFDEDIIVIDPADEPNKIFDQAKKIGKPISYVLLTHGHFDHCNGAKALQESGAKVYMSKADADMIEAGLDLAKYAGIEFNRFAPCGYLSEGKQSLGKHLFDVYETPGHTAGGLAFLFDGELFCGDTLFFMGVGRSDLPTANKAQLVQSIKKLYSLQNANVYPGHGRSTTLNFEKENNPYVKA
ncbi:MAG: MBL fold metallo-hydrolase [Clostridia bacterium]|nr:MBL fold metallo-hydrolase [Clostridia bacterium]